jgi:hypothetical protein
MSIRVEHDVAAAQPRRQRLGAGRLDGVEPGLGSRGQDVDELAIAAQPPLSVSDYSGRIISASQ